MLSLQSEVHSGGPKTKKIYFSLFRRNGDNYRTSYGIENSTLMS